MSGPQIGGRRSRARRRKNGEDFADEKSVLSPHQKCLIAETESAALVPIQQDPRDAESSLAEIDLLTASFFAGGEKKEAGGQSKKPLRAAIDIFSALERGHSLKGEFGTAANASGPPKIPLAVPLRFSKASEYSARTANGIRDVANLFPKLTDADDDDPAR